MSGKAPLFPSAGPSAASIGKWAGLAIALGVALFFIVELFMSSEGGGSVEGAATSVSSGAAGARISSSSYSCRAQAASYKKVPTSTGLTVFAMKDVTHYAEHNLGVQLPRFYSGELCGRETNLTAEAEGGSTKPECKGVVLDVGAFVGTHALYLASLGYDVHAFEVLPKAAELLRCSASANKLSANLRVTEEGVSDQIGMECMLNMWAGPAETQLVPKHLSVNASTTGCPYEEWTKVPVVTLDHYWEAVLKKRPIHFIKVDVEGHEDLVLKGGEQLFTEAPPPFMLVEYNHIVLAQKAVDIPKFMKRIFDYGYHVYDCQAQEMIAPGEFGASVLETTYAHKYGMTDMLLIHKDTFMARFKEKGAFVKIPCGHDETTYQKPDPLNG